MALTHYHRSMYPNLDKFRTKILDLFIGKFGVDIETSAEGVTTFKDLAPADNLLDTRKFSMQINTDTIIIRDITKEGTSDDQQVAILRLTPNNSNFEFSAWLSDEWECYDQLFIRMDKTWWDISYD